MSKTNTAKSYAEQGLEEVQQETVAAEGVVESSNLTSTDSEDYQQVGGFEPVAFFYRTSAPKKTPKSPYKILEKDQTILGTYERSFESGKFKNNTYIIRLNDNTLVGLPGTGSLTKAMNKLGTGSKVKITYNGMEAIKGGEWAGQDAHSFTVFGNKLKQA